MDKRSTYALAVGSGASRGVAPVAAESRRLATGLGTWNAAVALRGVGLVVLTGAAFLQAADVRAQSADVLQQLPGQNTAQNQISTAIDNVCPTLAQRSRSGADQSSDEADLAVICTQMIQTGANILSGSSGSGTFGTYDLDATELNNALQAVNGEELQSVQIRVADVQAANISARLAAVRAGLGGGIRVAGLRLGDEVASSDFGAPLGGVAANPGKPLAAGAGDGTVPLLGKLGLFLTGSIQWGQQDTTETISGFDFTVPGITAGVDYQVSDNLIAGASFGYSRFRADFNDSPLSPPGQDVESSSYLFSLFGSYYAGEHFFTDFIGTVGFSNYSTTRHIVIPSMGGTAPSIDEFAESDFDAMQYGVSANVGYEQYFGPLRLQPIARVNFLASNIDGATETGAGGLNLEYGDQDVRSLTTRLGIETSYSVSTAFGVLVPYIRGEYVHEFLNDQDGATVRFAADPTGLSTFVAATDPVDRNYGNVGGGVAVTLPGGWVTYVDYEALIGFRDLTSHTVAAGLRRNL